MTPYVWLLAKCSHLLYISFILFFNTLVSSSCCSTCVSGNVRLCVYVWWQSVSSTQHGHPLAAAKVPDPIRESECLLIFWHWEGNRQSYSSNVQWLKGPQEEWVLTECHLQFTSYSSILQPPKASLLSFIGPKLQRWKHIPLGEHYKLHF